jgi:hypothetical protein
MSVNVGGKGEGRGSTMGTKVTDNADLIQSDVINSPNLNSEHSTPTVPINLGRKDKGRWPKKETKDNDEIEVSGDVINGSGLLEEHSTPTVTMNQGGESNGRGSEKEHMLNEVLIVR